MTERFKKEDEELQEEKNYKIELKAKLKERKQQHRQVSWGLMIDKKKIADQMKKNHKPQT